MSRKHNTKHSRTPGGYRRRLMARGLTKAPKMEDVEVLRGRQARRKAETGSPWPSISETEEAA